MFGKHSQDQQNDDSGQPMPAPVPDDSLGVNNAADDDMAGNEPPQSSKPMVVPPPPEPADAPPFPQGPPSLVPDSPPAKNDENNNQAPPGSRVPEDDDLLAIKQKAITALDPLLDQLDQDPEEKFKTTMMMIQATDNKGLLKTAYEAAEAIKDEKMRARALLDVVNEINYFTQR